MDFLPIIIGAFAAIIIMYFIMYILGKASYRRDFEKRRRRMNDPNNPNRCFSKLIKELWYEHLYLEQLENSDIPDKYLKTVLLSGFRNDNINSYSFFFNPPKEGPWMNNFIRIVGTSKKLSDNPEKWEKDFSGLERTTLGLQKIAKGEIEGLYDEENK